MSEYVEIEIQDLDIKYYSGIIMKVSGDYLIIKDGDNYNYISIAKIIIIKTAKNLKLKEVCNVSSDYGIKDILIDIKERGVNIDLNTMKIKSNSLEITYVNDWLAKAKDAENKNPYSYYINLFFINAIENIKIDDANINWIK